MPTRALRFYFDYISPYSYLAWQELPDLVRRRRLTLEPIPILLAGLLDHHGHKGPAEIPPKRAYVFRDCVRRAAALEVPFNPPFSHPFHPLLSLRVTSLDMKPGTRTMLITRLFHATWVEGRDTSDTEVVGSVCNEVGVPDALARVQEQPIKDRLRDATASAVGLGVFGVPTMRIGEELFWGADSLVHLEGFLTGRDPLGDADREGWDRVQPSAIRKRSR
ncbi:MAG: 2-hydroxychromene-2-carboxylate isomerase [Polyangiales bacterium]